MKIIGQHEVLDKIFFLKLQETGEYTINYGELHTSAYDNWYLIDRTEQKEAEEIFEMFYRIWCNEYDDPDDTIEQWVEIGVNNVDSDDYINWE